MHDRQRSLALSAFLVLAFCSTSCTKKETPRDPVERIDDSTVKIYSDALPNIKRTTAMVSDFPELLNLMGKVGVTEDRTTIVPARVSGRTEAIFFASGEFVKAGQPLMTLFSADFVAAKEEYLQALRQAKTPPRASDPSDFSNLAKLSRKKLETMGLAVEDIRALTDSKTKESLLTIRAPRSGVIMTK